MKRHPSIPLIPAKAGTQVFSGPAAQVRGSFKNAWVPAFAGMSGFRVGR